MEYKILESNNVENENVDGASLNNSAFQGKSGIIKGILNECAINATTFNLTVDTGEIVISGFRVKITSPFSYVFSSMPTSPLAYQLVARIELKTDRNVIFSFLVRPSETLTQNDLFKTESGIYEIELANFVVYPTGIVNSTIVKAGKINLINEENIDKAISDAVANINYSNENLLINPDFKINQRGKTIYTGTRNSRVFTADRWALIDGNINYTFSPNTGNGATFTTTESSSSIEQYIETPLELSTKYTFSISSSFGVAKATFTTPSSLPTATTTYLSFPFSGMGTYYTAYVTYDSSNGYWRVRISIAQNISLTINWVKLEKGDIATPFVAPDITTELLKCQRYFIKFSGNGTFVGTGFSSSTTVSFVQVALAVPTMIQKPTVEMSGCYLVSANHLASGSLSASYYDNTSFNQNAVKIEVSATGLTKGEYNMLQIRSSSGYLSLDAEI